MIKISVICAMMGLLLTACSSWRKNFCANTAMNNYKFFYVSGGQVTNNYILIKDSLQLEYEGNELYSEAVINWNGCFDYTLVTKQIYYKEGLQLGDTLFVKIKSFKNDTLECIASAKNRSIPVKLLRTGNIR